MCLLKLLASPDLTSPFIVWPAKLNLFVKHLSVVNSIFQGYSGSRGEEVGLVLDNSQFLHGHWSRFLWLLVTVLGGGISDSFMPCSLARSSLLWVQIDFGSATCPSLGLRIRSTANVTNPLSLSSGSFTNWRVWRWQPRRRERGYYDNNDSRERSK